MAEEGEEGAAFSVVALLLAVCGSRGFSSVDEIGRRRTTVGVWEPARRGGARHRLRGHLAQVAIDAICPCHKYGLRIKGEHVCLLTR